MRLSPLILPLFAGCVTSAPLDLSPDVHRLMESRRSLIVERARLAEAEAALARSPPAKAEALAVLDVVDDDDLLERRELAALSTYVGLIAVERGGYRVVARDDAVEGVLSARILRSGPSCLLGIALPLAKWGRLEETGCDLPSMYRAAERALSTLPKAGETKR